MKIVDKNWYDIMMGLLNKAPSDAEFIKLSSHLYVKNSDEPRYEADAEFIEVEIMGHDGWRDGLVSHDFLDELLCLKDIERGLLEYRRQNNIFEDGDYIIDTLIGNKVIKYHDGYKDMPGNYVSSFLIHANDAEIKAGRRLNLPQVGSIIEAYFKNAAGEDIQVVGKVRELKGKTICCNEVGTGKPFFCLPGEFKKYDLPKSVIQSLGEVS